MKAPLRLLLLALCWTWGNGAAHACSCDPISPEAGFERAQYVFTGQVVEAERHIWLVEVERVWKGGEKLGRVVRLMDAYAQMDCEFFFELGQRYLFFAVVAKGGREVFYHPQVCSWTRPLHSTRVATEGNESLWLEDLIARNHGPGAPPRKRAAEDTSRRDPARADPHRRDRDGREGGAVDGAPRGAAGGVAAVEQPPAPLVGSCPRAVWVREAAQARGAA